MTDAAALVRRLLGTPGTPNTTAKELWEEAASAHADLLVHASAGGDTGVRRSIAPLWAYRRRSPPAREKCYILCLPLLIEGLHALAPFCARLRHWHDGVSSPPAPNGSDQIVPAARASLGNVALAIRLRSDPHWQGEHDLCTDVFGRLNFPFCNWSLTLQTEQHEPLATQAVKFSLDCNEARWRLEDSEEPPFLVMTRADCLRMLVGNSDFLDGRRLVFPNPRVRPRLQWASSLPHSAIS